MHNPHYQAQKIRLNERISDNKAVIIPGLSIRSLNTMVKPSTAQTDLKPKDELNSQTNTPRQSWMAYNPSKLKTERCLLRRAESSGKLTKINSPRIRKFSDIKISSSSRKSTVRVHHQASRTYDWRGIYTYDQFENKSKAPEFQRFNLSPINQVTDLHSKERSNIDDTFINLLDILNKS